MTHEEYGDKIKKVAKDAAFDYAEEKLREKSKPYTARAVKGLVSFSDVTIDKGYKISYEVIEGTLPPKISREAEIHLRNSTNLLKSKNRETIEVETVALVNSSINALMNVAKDEQSFDEASRALIAQSKAAVKSVVIENAKDVAIREARQILKVGATNPVINALVVGDLIKDSALRLLEGKIDEAQFIKEVTRRCTVLALQTICMGFPGGAFASMAVSHACNELFSLMDAAETQAAADRRKIISKIKSEALAEMERQREIMKKCFADEKFRWDKNIQVGFELISKGTYSNDAEIIAQGFDKIMKNFGGQVAFSTYEEFDDFFMEEDSVLKL